MTRQSIWLPLLIAFQIGFSGNAVLWRWEQGRFETIGYPAVCLSVNLLALGVFLWGHRKGAL